MSVLDVKTALESACSNVYHYQAPESAPNKYIVWGETGVEGFSSDGIYEEIIVSGSAYYYTDVEFDTTVNSIAQALSNADISWKCTPMGYEDELGHSVYNFEWSVPSGSGGIY